MFIGNSQRTSTMAAVSSLHLNDANHCFINFFELFAKVRAEMRVNWSKVGRKEMTTWIYSSFLILGQNDDAISCSNIYN
jgi:hypothetical protein